MKNRFRANDTHERIFAELEALHRRSRARDERSNEKIAGLIRDFAFRFARQEFKLSSDRADEIAQDFYLAYAGCREQITDLRCWLIRVASVVAYEYMRQSYRWRMGKKLSREWYLSPESPEQQIIDRLLARESMRSLDRRDGLIVYLREWQGFGFADIALKVHLTADNAKQRYYRALQKLALRLGARRTPQIRVPIAAPTR